MPDQNTVAISVSLKLLGVALMSSVTIGSAIIAGLSFFTTTNNNKEIIEHAKIIAENTINITDHGEKIEDHVEKIDRNSTTLVQYTIAIDQHADNISENTASIKSHLGKIEGNTNQISKNAELTATYAGRIDVATSQIAVHTRDIARDAEHTSIVLGRLADVIAPSNLAEPTVCRANTEISLDQSCSWLGTPQQFKVVAEGAYSPWDVDINRSLNENAIKVDVGYPLNGTTFQANRTGPDTWTIFAAGRWQDLGTCEKDQIIRAGQFCLEPYSGQPFLVYATDELVDSDRRDLYVTGYGVLFWWKDGQTPHPVENGRLRPDEIVCRSANTGSILFKATRQSGKLGLEHQDTWKIIKSTPASSGEMVCEPLGR